MVSLWNRRRADLQNSRVRAPDCGIGPLARTKFRSAIGRKSLHCSHWPGEKIDGGGFDLWNVTSTPNDTIPFDTPGTYHLFGYAGTLQGPPGIAAAGPNAALNAALSVLNPQPGYAYKFSNNTKPERRRPDNRRGARAGGVAVGDARRGGPLARAAADGSANLLAAQGRLVSRDCGPRAHSRQRSRILGVNSALASANRQF